MSKKEILLGMADAIARVESAVSALPTLGAIDKAVAKLKPVEKELKLAEEKIGRLTRSLAEVRKNAPLTSQLEVARKEITDLTRSLNESRFDNRALSEAINLARIKIDTLTIAKQRRESIYRSVETAKEFLNQNLQTNLFHISHVEDGMKEFRMRFPVNDDVDYDAALGAMLEHIQSKIKCQKEEEL